mmetsp:Transcript_10863/g.19020  ORF Transcript_10863/g.19020 Transcript_10863/m.19020 type:complete len:161 (+) Transcript_10863:554-1036(+)
MQKGKKLEKTSDGAGIGIHACKFLPSSSAQRGCESPVHQLSSRELHNHTAFLASTLLFVGLQPFQLLFVDCPSPLRPNELHGIVGIHSLFNEGDRNKHWSPAETGDAVDSNSFTSFVVFFYLKNFAAQSKPRAQDMVRRGMAIGKRPVVHLNAFSLKGFR